VENSGEIDTAEISRLTETFYRAKNANQSGVKGSGLGLSIVQYICHIHGGELQLSKSSLGGLAVKVRLKRLHSQVEAEGE
jgi:two-component system sensor histidine kinase BaeS